MGMTMMKINWDVIIGFWLGVAVITLISIARTALHQTLYQYDWTILALSIIVLIVALILKKRSIKCSVENLSDEKL